MKKSTLHALLYMRILRHETQRERLSGFAQGHTTTSSAVKASSVSIVAHGGQRCVVTLQCVALAGLNKISQLPSLNVSH